MPACAASMIALTVRADASAAVNACIRRARSAISPQPALLGVPRRSRGGGVDDHAYHLGWPAVRPWHYPAARFHRPQAAVRAPDPVLDLVGAIRRGHLVRCLEQLRNVGLGDPRPERVN